MNPYLSKGYAPLREEFDIAELEIAGRWPEGLEGSFYRIGPNPQFEPRGTYNPLQADGMVHVFHVRAGRVAYRNRWVRTQQWEREHAAGRALYSTSAAPYEADPSVAGQRTNGVANTNLVWHAGKLLALEEGHPPFAVDPETLQTLGRYSFAGKLPRNMTAHPKIDPGTGELVLFANFESFRAPQLIGLHSVDGAGALTWSMQVETPFPAMVHDFALTRDFIMLPVCPVTVSMQRATEGRSPIAWEPRYGTHVALISRKTGEVRWFEGEPCMAWHVVNGFNEDDRVTVDVCSQVSPAFPAPNGAMAENELLTQRLTRWTFDWSRSGAFESRTLHDERCEYPRIDPRRETSAHRHVYVACQGGPGSADIFQRGIGHYDAATGVMRTWSAGETFAVAEPVFAPGGPREGEGWLLTNIYDETRDASFLAVFNAEDVSSGPIARAHVPHRVPVGFHGLWRAA